jgi:3',5'-cyclic AMP phosphodiesterase CpdA
VNTTTEQQISRRQLLSFAGTAGLGISLGSFPVVGADAVRAAESGPNRKRTLRVAHLTDVHVKPELGAVEGLTAALRHVQALDDAPQLLLTGGDAIMDALAVDAARTELQWDLWKRVLKNECPMPVEHCIGNHDVWGWDKKKSKTTGREDQWGKQSALDNFGLDRRYRSFDKAGWHFIVLDSIHPHDELTYIGKLDDEQFDWLAGDLKKTDRGTPTVIVSHIPILTVALVEFSDVFARQPERRQGATHVDAKRIVDLFKQHPNVKLCLSGHLHLTERIDYSGVTYICSGAVSGNWWRGDHHHTDEGYTVIDLYNDGTFDNQYVAYGWTPRE